MRLSSVGNPADPKPGDRFEYVSWGGSMDGQLVKYTVVSRDRFDIVGDSIVVRFDHSGAEVEWYTRDIRSDTPVE